MTGKLGHHRTTGFQALGNRRSGNQALLPSTESKYGEELKSHDLSVSASSNSDRRDQDRDDKFCRSTRRDDVSRDASRDGLVT